MAALLLSIAACESRDRWIENEPEYVLEKVTELGAADGEAALAGVRWVGPGAAGGIVVLESGTFDVHVFRSDGTRRLRFGGKGDGPGQVRSSHLAAQRPGGVFVVGETYPPQLHFFNDVGAYLESLDPWQVRARAPEESAGAFGRWFAIARDTAWLQVNPIPVPGGGVSEAYLLRFVRDETGQWYSVPVKRWANALSADPIGPPLLSPVPAWAAGPGGGFYFTSADEYRIEKRAGDLSKAHTIQRSVEASPVTAAVRSATFRSMRTELSESLPAGAIEDLLGSARFASTLPIIDRLLYDQDAGRLWAGRPDGQTLAEQRAPSVWDLFEADGTTAGSVVLPDGYRLVQVRADLLYGIWRDDLDVEYVRVYELRSRGG